MWGRRIILRQQQLIVENQALDLSTEQSESLLAIFQVSQRIFEEHFAALLKSRDKSERGVATSLLPADPDDRIYIS
jgi:hypothetical protein